MSFILEHLLEPELQELDTLDATATLAAQAGTADWLTEIGSPEGAIKDTQLAKARAAFASVTDPNQNTAQKKSAILALKVPAAVRHLAGMLSQYDWDYIEQAKEIRGYVTAKLMEETTHPDARIRLRSLELMGKLSGVDSFMERVTVIKVDATSDELTERIRAKLAGLLPKTIEVETVPVKEFTLTP